MKFVVYGAGGIGGVIGARLLLAGFEVTLIARGEHAQVMQSNGLKLIAPDGQHRFKPNVVTSPQSLQLDKHTAVLMCMKSQHMQTALEDLSKNPSAPAAHIVCVQNGIPNEPLATRFFPYGQVYASVVNLPAMFLTPGEVVTHAKGCGGILDTGLYPFGSNDFVLEYVQALNKAGFSAFADNNVMRWKYAKLLLNLVNALQACLQDFENSGELRRRAKKEALACYEAAGISCASREELNKRRHDANQQPLYEMADIPGYERQAGSSWQSLARGKSDIETNFLNGEISLLGKMHQVATPVNDLCVSVAAEVVAQNLPPCAFTVEEFMRRLK